MPLSYADLLAAVAEDGVGVRARIALEPLGGPDDKIFPPTYNVGGRAAYAVEQRRVAGETVESVVLDSVSSQANRFESALLDAYRRREVALPVVSVDFSEAEGVRGLDRISSLEAPHRIFDALLRDSMSGDTLFRLGDVGRAITEASPRNAAALFRYAPHTLVWGGWDSTGPRGGLGAKYERAITSEIVATGVVGGKKTSSRIDPAGIEKRAGTIYEAPADKGRGWTLDSAEAVKDSKGEPKRKGKGQDAGRPSEINHGNYPPSIDDATGGITADAIGVTTVLSLVQLRRLRFPLSTDDTPVAADKRLAAEAAARTTLASLGLAAAVLAFDDGFDLRSRCVLVATENLEFELLRRGGGDTHSFTLSRAEALELLEASASHAADAGFLWESEELLLKPLDDLVTLVRKSQEITAEGEEET